MRRLIALLFAALFSVFAGVEYVLPKDDNFYMSSVEGDQPYFKVDEDGEVLYKSLYRTARNVSLSEAEMCDTTPRQDTRDSWVEIPDVGGLSGIGDIWQGLYSPVAEGKYTATKMSSKDGVTFTVSVDEDVNITAPAAGKINTSHFACDGGSTMEFVITWSDGNVYTMSITDAKCWYCCAHKEEPEDGRYTATTNDSLKGQAMSAGDVLCVGKNGTTITIVRAEPK